MSSWLMTTRLIKPPQVAREAGAEVIRHSENLGKGAAIKTGSG